MTWRNRNLYLIGLPGSGKTAIGRTLAAMVDRFELIDLDNEIECKTGATISEIFTQEGEQKFRELESEVLLQIASASGTPKIVATGGGIVLNPINRAIIRGSGIPIWIDVTVREAARNIWNDVLQGHERPMFAGATLDEIRTILTRLLKERRTWYEQSVLHFVRRTQGSEHTVDELSAELLTALEKMSLSVALKPKHGTTIAKSALGNYPVFAGSGTAPREIGYYVREQGFSSAFIVTDENVAAHHLESFISGVRLRYDTIGIYPIVLRAGEWNKNLETLQSVLQEFHNHRASRRTSIVIGFGGGVVTDIAALAAHLYHRGLPLALVPTTVMGQVDAAIGGKTGIDAFGNKNTIGTFYAPRIVAVDPLYLRTLEDRERNAGLAEALKYGLIGNQPMWQRLSADLPHLLKGASTKFDEIVFRSIEEKLRYVNADEFERKEGTRELLNFGHTFGHALEGATNFKLFLHGEAVLLGMRAATWLSNRLEYLSDEEAHEIEAALSSISIRVPSNVTLDNVFQAFERDKKGSGRVILLRSIGEAFVTEITRDNAQRAIERMLSFL
ncbi:MAG TPA: bifunctional shikimate kinase/3-dehydroquinate synthase [Candidatus Kapabacteria bacterium]|jgi:3-dehydroquinate synthetase/shikimate kinase